jgi:hypothetical protein
MDAAADDLFGLFHQLDQVLFVNDLRSAFGVSGLLTIMFIFSGVRDCFAIQVQSSRFQVAGSRFKVPSSRFKVQKIC